MGESLASRLKFLAVAGVGLFADGYLNISIGFVVPMIGFLYFQNPTTITSSKVPTIQADEIKGSLSIGMAIGQLLFGVFGDAIGRHRVYGKELLITIFGTLMVILLPWNGLSKTGIVAWLSVFRVLTGVGIGADYPITSSLSAEQKRFGSRSKLILTVFSFFGLGVMTSGIVVLILLAAFKSAIDNDLDRLQWVWRLLFGLGIIPCAATVYARLQMPTTKAYEKYVANGATSQPTTSRGLKIQFDDFCAYFGQPKHARVLIAQSLIWFLFDIAYYGVNLNQSIILAKIGYAGGTTPYQVLHNLAVGNIIASAAGYLPGFYVGIFLPDIVGRKTQQLVGSTIVAILYAIWAGVFSHTSTGGLMTLFTLSQFFLTSGPNVTTFLLPVELFPTRVRATAHGIAAASGKCGAILTAFAFGSITDAIGVPGVLWLFAGIMALCAILTMFIPETRGLSLDDLEGEVLYGGGKIESPESSDVSVLEVEPSKGIQVV